MIFILASFTLSTVMAIIGRLSNMDTATLYVYIFLANMTMTFCIASFKAQKENDEGSSKDD